MINHEVTDIGGSVRVNCTEGMCSLSYQFSNNTAPLCMTCSVGRGSVPHLVSCVLSSLVEKHSPVVVLMRSKDTAVRFHPRIGELFRCWTEGDQTVYAKAFASRKLLERVCSLSYAMQNADFVRVQNDQVDLFDYHDVLKGIREHTSPFEFLSIKEECDYSLKTCAVGCLRTLVECAEGEMESLSMSDREAFAEVARRLLSQQELETFRFDTKYSYIQEAVTGLLLPALVKYGADHPFTSAVFAEFSKQASVYTKASEQFMDEYGEIMNQKSQSEDESTTY